MRDGGEGVAGVREREVERDGGEGVMDACSNKSFKSHHPPPPLSPLPPVCTLECLRQSLSDSRGY